MQWVQVFVKLPWTVYLLVIPFFRFCGVVTEIIPGIALVLEISMVRFTSFHGIKEL